MKFIFLLSLPLYALDQATKWLALHYVTPEGPLARFVMGGSR